MVKIVTTSTMKVSLIAVQRRFTAPLLTYMGKARSNDRINPIMPLEEKKKVRRIPKDRISRRSLWRKSSTITRRLLYEVSFGVTTLRIVSIDPSTPFSGRYGTSEQK